MYVLLIKNNVELSNLNYGLPGRIGVAGTLKYSEKKKRNYCIVLYIFVFKVFSLSKIHEHET